MYKEKQVFVDTTLPEGLFFTRVSSNAGIRIERVVRVTIICCFMKDVTSGLRGASSIHQSHHCLFS